MANSVAKWSDADLAHMTAALGLARRGLGRTAPNPNVGCVLVKDGALVGRGWTQPGGRPHAEVEALGRAGTSAKGACAYVTLEPCAHHGVTPPCCDALIAAGIARCVVALSDPDPRVNGAGLHRLREAGVAVELGCLAESAAEVTAGFLMRSRHGRPFVTLKLATSLDGRIATASGESCWITGEAARARAHLLRAQHDAVLVGGGTALADDPRLDVRLPGLTERRPLRVVLDGRLRLPVTHRLVRDAAQLPSLLIMGEEVPDRRTAPYAECGLEIARVARDRQGRLDMVAVLTLLGGRGLTRLLVEGGAGIAGSLLEADLVDCLAWFRAPLVLGGDALPASASLGFGLLAQAPRFRRLAVETLGPDLLETYLRNA